MKINQGSEHVWKLSIWMLIPISVWVVKEEDGITLVDAGVSQMAKGIRSFFESLNAGPLKRILLTHGHADHIGAIGLFPMFTANMNQAIESGQIVGQLKPKVASICHGEDVYNPHQQYAQYKKSFYQGEYV